MVNQDGEQVPGRRIGSPTVVEITAKLKRMCDLLGLTLSDLQTDLVDYKIDPRTVAKWFENPSVIRRPSRDDLVRYFRSKHRLPFDHKCFMIPLVEFNDRMEHWQQHKDGELNLVEPERKKNAITVNLADSSSQLVGAEKTYICGKYLTYRLSASDTEKVVTEVISIRPRQDTELQCDVVMYCNKVEGDTLDQDRPVEEFSGNLFKFGSTYMIIITYSNGADDKRPRVIQFPIVPTLLRGFHFGIITGYSVHREDHFSGRILAQKIALDPALASTDRKKVRRLSASDRDVVKYASLLQNDPHKEGEKLMTVDKRVMGAFVRNLNGR